MGSSDGCDVGKQPGIGCLGGPRGSVRRSLTKLSDCTTHSLEPLGAHLLRYLSVLARIGLDSNAQAIRYLGIGTVAQSLQNL
jgi:hypothetical protein